MLLGNRLFFVMLLTSLFLGCSHRQSLDSEEASSSSKSTSDGKPVVLSASDEYQIERYKVEKDFSPEMLLRAQDIKDAVPKLESKSRGGNYSPYTVFGKTYEVMADAKGYKARGGASWYGLKFHGHKTSNGEIYDVYKMSAAHKTLPIPSYARVTNLLNKRSCIVRVNDRGPFHDGRIIDLSYAAATKLGYIGDGTAQVEVEAIDPKVWLAMQSQLALQKKSTKKAVLLTKTIYLQIAAYTQVDIANEMYQNLYAKYNHPVFLESGKDRFHRLKIGPVAEQELAQIQVDLATEGYPAPVRLKSP